MRHLPAFAARRLVRVPHLAGFRAAVVSLTIAGEPLDARDRLVIVPTRAAGTHLRRSIEERLLAEREVVILPDLVTPGELVGRLAERLAGTPRMLDAAEREVLLGVAARTVEAAGIVPPFRLRPALVAEMLRFYDALRRHHCDVDAFERRTLGVLEPGALDDRGAERLVRQTRFLAAAFRELERQVADAGADEHLLRSRLVTGPIERPWRHVVVAVGDRAFDPHGLHGADWDLLARLPGLQALDVVITDTALAGACHERLHALLPGIEEVRVPVGGADDSSSGPRLRVSPAGTPVHVVRDREEEVALFARHVKRAYRHGDLPEIERAALVVRQPLPYVYLARDVLQSGGVPCQLFDALPLAAEPYAVALDLVLSVVTSDVARLPALDLLRSPLVRCGAAGAARPSMQAVAACERELADAGFVDGADALGRLVERWQQAGASPRTSRALPAAVALIDTVRELAPLMATRPVAEHLGALMAFLRSHEEAPPDGEPERTRHLRARGAVLGLLETLRDAHQRFDSRPVAFERTANLVRRWIEAHTFAPHTGSAGVHVVDAAAARFGDFSDVQLAGLVEGEWPDRPRRSIFYTYGVLKELGWPADADRRAGADAEFRDLLRLPSRRLVLSMFALEADALTAPSPLLADLDAVGLTTVEDDLPPVRIFDHEALTGGPVDVQVLAEGARAWAGVRLEAPADAPRFHGSAGPVARAGWAVSALERYQDCPFRFFAADVLRLEPPAGDDAAGQRSRGRLLHEVCQRFFEAWDARGGGTLRADRLDQARALFVEVAEPLLDALPEADRPAERIRLFGSAVAMGVADVLIGLEAARPVEVRGRLLEYRLDGGFSFGEPDVPPVALRGVADRIDLLPGRRLRVLDYKSGRAPTPSRALQVPVYALAARERLSEQDGARWEVEEAAYVAVGGRRPLVSVVKPGDRSAGEILDAARARLLAVLEGIGRGEFPPRPHDPRICTHCPYPSVCRKEYVGDA